MDAREKSSVGSGDRLFRETLRRALACAIQHADLVPGTRIPH
jgi:hypothetical protein